MARAWVAEDPALHMRVNRDDLRDMTQGGWTGAPEHEDAVTAIAHAAVCSLLHAGYDVVCDDARRARGERAVGAGVIRAMHAQFPDGAGR